MRTTFRFSDKESFWGTDSQAFAVHLSKAPELVRQHIRKVYGLEISVDSSPMRVKHDGRKVGLGSFLLEDGVIHFAIMSKGQRASLSCMLTALAGSEQSKGNVRFDALAKDGPVGTDDSEFAPAYQKALLEEIVQTLRRLSEFYNSKRVVNTRGGVRGRPLLNASLSNIFLGRRLEFQCEILNDQALQPYVVTLLATAKQIHLDLLEIAEFIPGMTDAVTSLFRAASSSCPGIDLSCFNRSLMLRVCRPPYPYNLRAILGRCMRFWHTKGRFSFSEHEKFRLNFWGMVADMDMLFQDYIGHVLKSTCSDIFQIQSSRNGKFSVGGDDGENRSVEPDHIIVHNAQQVAIVVDAKYRTDVATGEQVAQILSYLSYTGFKDLNVCDRKIGILAYPGEEFTISAIEPFDRELYAIKMPIQASLQSSEIRQWVNAIVDNQAPKDVRCRALYGK